MTGLIQKPIYAFTGNFIFSMHRFSYLMTTILVKFVAMPVNNHWVAVK